jgi:hypothetical protein
MMSRSAAKRKFWGGEIKKTLDLFDKNNYSVFENPARITVNLVKILIDKEFDHKHITPQMAYTGPLQAEIAII